MMLGTKLRETALLRRLAQSLTIAAGVYAIFAGPASPAAHVVGGTPVQVQSAPWSAFVVYHTGSVDHRCTGSVIDASHVLTAAHCVYARSTGALASAQSLSVVAGVSNFLSPAPTDAEQDRSVASFRVHPGYVNIGSQVPDDVAVLALAQPLDLSGPSVKSVSLPGPGFAFPAGAPVTVAGFGLTSSTDSHGGPLESMSATVAPQGDCGQFTEMEVIVFSNSVELCATAPASALCDGDSGAALVTSSGTPLLIGVAVGAAPGCSVGSAAIFVYTGAPEIEQFVQGNDTPPTAPRASATTSIGLKWKKPLDVGGTLTCSTDGWPMPVQITYTFLNAATDQVLQAGTRAAYVIPRAAQGAAIECEVQVGNSGGTTVERSTPTPRIGAAAQTKPVRAVIGPIAPITARRGQHITLHVMLERPPGLSGTLKVCARLPASVGGGLSVCRSIRERAGTGPAVPFALGFTIKRTAALGLAHIAVTAESGPTITKTVAVLRVVSS